MSSIAACVAYHCRIIAEHLHFPGDKDVHMARSLLFLCCTLAACSGSGATTADGNTTTGGSGGGGGSAAVQATAIASGKGVVCAVMSERTLECWGETSDGCSERQCPTRPFTVDGLAGVTAVAVGDALTCAVVAGGAVQCLGVNSQNQLGNTTSTVTTTPVTVAGLAPATAVTAGNERFFACAVSDGETACWGQNELGELGDGSLIGSPSPVIVNGIANPISISSGGSFTCAALGTGATQCWGDDVGGTLGDPDLTTPCAGIGSDPCSTKPVVVRGLSNALTVTAGFNHACAILADNTVACWGTNFHGELGNGTTIDSTTPVAVSGLHDVTAISAGEFHTCAVGLNGNVQCWGDNSGGQLGSTSDSGDCFKACASTPVAVPGVTDVIALTTGDDFSCALEVGGLVLCWGKNSGGELGDGTLNPSVTPVIVPL